MEERRKSTRENAGVNKSLPADFMWPERFGENRGGVESAASKSNSHGSQVSLERKRLAIEMEKKRQELEKKRQELEKAQLEIQSNMRLLEMEHDFENARLDAIDEVRSHKTQSRKTCLYPTVEVQIKSQAGQSASSKEEREDNNSISKTLFIDNWVNESRQQHHQEGEMDLHTIDNASTNLAESMKFKQSNDIEMLCRTIANVIKVANPPHLADNSGQDKFFARQVVERDFPIFDGNPEDWPLFHQQFQRISRLCDYSDEEKMTKLQKCLKGEARSAVAGMMLISENIHCVIDTLRLRFGRPEFIIETIIAKIRGLPVIKEKNVEKLIQFSSEINNLIATMKTLESKGHMQNPQLLRDLLSKLPDLLKLRWGERVVEQRGKANLDDFSKWLGEIARAACYISTPDIPNTHPIEKQVNLRKPERVFSTSGTPIIESLCGYCDKKHGKLCSKMENDDVDVRWKTVTEKKLCFVCLRGRHQKLKCRRKRACQVQGCRFFHHPLLHKEFVEAPMKDKLNQSDTKSQIDTVLAIKHEKRKILLRMIPVKLYSGKECIQVLALCDEASTVTIIDEQVVRNLGLAGFKESLCLQWTNDIISNEENSERLDIRISGKNEGEEIFTLKGVHTVGNISLPSQTIEIGHWKSYPHLKDLPIHSIYNEKPVLLIGQDNINLIAVRRLQSGPENVPVATRCKLGWSLHGPTLENVPPLRAQTLHICNTVFADCQLQEMVKKSFSTEEFGVMVTANKIKAEDVTALEIMKRTARRVENRFEIGLLWRDENIHLPESKFNAFQRLKCMERKCQKDASFAINYNEKIESYIEKGYARKLDPREESLAGPRTWYLPHFAVENSNKPGKIRLVFDAAAKSRGYSLNDFLLPGPDLLQSLVAILWKFRQRRIGFCGDIREMFHQIEIREEDRSSQRFLWRNLDYQRDPDTYEMTVMTFGATCSPVCAQYIKNLNAEQLAETPEILTAITKKFYVDDYLDSTDSDEEALETILEVRRIQKLGGFDIVNWMTNSPFIRKSLSVDLIASSKNLTDGTLHRVLGLWWDSDTDEFLFKIDKIECISELFTKRSVLRLLMSLFDPLGFVSSFTVRAKILMQDIWRTDIKWDEELPDNLKKIWIKWKEDLEEIGKIRIPRCYSAHIPVAEKIEIHIFCDSSEKAFASVAYLRVVSTFVIDVAFLAAKTRVAPLKPLSIPRLELQAAVMSSRLLCSIKSELEINIDQVFYWTDSKCVLKWIRGDATRFKQFVAHRIGEIQETSHVIDWKWVPTKLNPADEATRGSFGNSQKQTISDIWFSGPTFLKETEEFWPKEESSMEISDTDEIKKVMVIANVEPEISNISEALPNINRFSSWLKLVRTTAWVLRFTTLIKANSRNNSNELTIEEIDKAKTCWVQYSQEECFPEDLKKLKKGLPLDKNSKLLPLSPRLHNGLLVVGGRTELSPTMDSQSKNPIIMSPKNRYTKLLIHHFHEKFRHQGVELVLNELRQKYWIMNGRSAVKSTFSNCQMCKNARVKPVLPLMGQLPPPRLTREVRPFVNVGMDYFGPIYVAVGRRKEKRWGVLFTCLAVRAIHLEIAHSLTTDSAIMAIRRMVARRGYPKMIRSDNGTNLRGAANELRQAIKELTESSSKIADTMASKGIDFRFNPPSSPHMGGVWERLIGSVKRVIGKILYGQSLRDETLSTLFAEAENIVNSRPLTKISTDPADIEALTPNHFLIGSSNGDGSPVKLDPNQSCIRREWKKSQMFIDMFWNRWVREYLPTLNKRNKWTIDQRPIQIDDVVILVDDNAPRYSWKMGRIIQTYPGPDGRIRVVDVKTQSTVYRRPVAKICRLELE